ncbi:MAG: MFS transporter [Coriobacteriales bacterium]|jgi:GPH family glycoside/pentoside/hexuronide:cation symporter|nr:MFS transporter [Coriobacteriales bacterium]
MSGTGMNSAGTSGTTGAITPKKRLGTIKMILLAVGFVGSGLLITTLSMYTLRFFAPTEGLGIPLLVPIGWIGIIQGIATGFDCLIDPLIASWSDNSKNPKGRRLPFMRKAFLPAAIFALLVFFAPVPELSVFNALWVLVMFLAYSFTRSIFDINLQALLPEIVADSHRRLRFYAIRTGIGIVFQLVVALVPGVVEGLRASGMEAISAWQMLLTVFPLVAIVLMLPTVLCIRETDYVTPAPPEQEKTGVWASIIETLKVKPFRVFVSAAVLFSCASGVATAALLFYIDVLFGMSGGMASTLMIIMVLASFVFYPVVMMVSKRVGKKSMMMVSCVVCLVGYLIIFFYEPIGALFGTAPLPAGDFWANLAGEGAQSGYIVLLLLMGVIFGFPITTGNLLTNTAFSDIMQYHSIRTGRTRSGMFAAAVNIILAIPSTLVPAVVGVLIYLGTTNNMPTVMGVQSTALVAAMVCIPAFIVFRLYQEREVLDTIATAQVPALDAKGAGDALDVPGASDTSDKERVV